jgi:hypothetical protein
MSVREMSLKDNHIELFARHLFAAPVQTLKSVLGGESHQALALMVSGYIAQDIGRCFETYGPLIPTLTDFATGRTVGHPVVGYGGRHNQDVGIGQALQDLGVHLSGSGSLNLPYPRDSRHVDIRFY